MKKSLWWVVVVLALSVIACQATPSLRSSSTKQGIPTATIAPQLPLTTGSGAADSSEEALVALYERVNPGVVAILITAADGSSGQGSGFVYDTDGHIITNLHVVDGAETIEVDFPSGYKAEGELIATDQDSDLAVVKVNAPAEELHPLPLGDSDQIKVGQTVIAIGNPFGLDGTMTRGIVSAKGRTLDSLRQTSSGATFSVGDIIQTDASINPGNSGGPLINLNGEVIGINRAIRTTNYDSTTGEALNSGIGFAVSINIVRRVVPVLISKGRYDYPYLGVTARPQLTLAEVKALGLDRNTGAYVLEVASGGPAAKAGLRGGKTETSIPELYAGGDLIIGVDGRPVKVFGDLLSYLMNNKSPGDQVVITVVRDNQEKEVTVTLDKRP
ncbi:MAG: trypsin-like peptidase domain-containing protein [Anaerolineaceae bacterium]